MEDPVSRIGKYRGKSPDFPRTRGGDCREKGWDKWGIIIVEKRSKAGTSREMIPDSIFPRMFSRSLRFFFFFYKKARCKEGKRHQKREMAAVKREKILSVICLGEFSQFTRKGSKPEKTLWSGRFFRRSLAPPHLFRWHLFHGIRILYGNVLNLGKWPFFTVPRCPSSIFTAPTDGPTPPTRGNFAAGTLGSYRLRLKPPRFHPLPRRLIQHVSKPLGWTKSSQKHSLTHF